MSKYNEPWKLCGKWVPKIADSNGNSVISAAMNHFPTQDQMRRIALCVNFCQGLTDEELAGKTLEDIAKEAHAKRVVDEIFDLIEPC